MTTEDLLKRLNAGTLSMEDAGALLKAGSVAPMPSLEDLKAQQMANAADAVADMVGGYGNTNSLDAFLHNWFDHNPVHDRDLPHAVYDVVTEECLTAEEEFAAVTTAWKMPEYPEANLGRDRWLTLFRRLARTDQVVGDDGVLHRSQVRVPSSLWRGAIPRRKMGMAWTGDRERAEWFVQRFESSTGFHLYRLDNVPVSAVLARFESRSEDEYVIDTDGLDPIRVS